METKLRNLSRRDMLKLASAAAAAAVAPLATARRNDTARAATRPTARLFMTDNGTGKNVLLLHGWTCDSNDWNWQLPEFESKYRVIAPDLRGHGRSEVMPSGAYAPADYVADIEALISSKHAGRKFIIVGHSMGGQIAARVAARRPDLVGAVVSIDGALGFSSGAAKLFAKTVHDLNAGDPGVVAPALFNLVYAPSTDPGFKSWHARRVKGMPADVVRESFAPLFFGPEQVGIGAGSEKLCRSLTVPVYHMCRNPVQAERMRPWFSHAKSKVDVWNHSGHWIMQDRPQDVNAAVRAWIDAL
jgi:pimeloyl-ACP methyl ester carboxylesterase